MQKAKFLFVGNGRLSHHLQFYFNSLGIPYSLWTRAEGLSELYDRIELSTHILLPISDSVLADFYHSHLVNCEKMIIHFSGALDIPDMHSVHPLMTFGPEMYQKDFYPQIPFVTSSSLDMKKLLPGLPNSIYRIRPQDKAYYHTLCVIGGNLTSMLVSKMQNGMKEIGLPANIANTYVHKSVDNVFQNSGHFLTGPLARKDFLTVQKNLDSLQDDPYQKIYQAFIPMTFPEFLNSQKNVAEHANVENNEDENENPRL